MEKTKSDFDSQEQLRNQTGIVKAILRGKKHKEKRLFIPGGRNILEDIDKQNLTDSLYTWMRFSKDFDGLRFSLVAPEANSKYKMDVRKVKDFPKSDVPHWETAKTLRRGLAEEIAQVVMTTKFLYIDVTKEGIFVATEVGDSFSPESDDFCPTLLFTPSPRNRSTFSTTAY